MGWDIPSCNVTARKYTKGSKFELGMREIDIWIIVLGPYMVKEENWLSHRSWLTKLVEYKDYALELMTKGMNIFLENYNPQRNSGSKLSVLLIDYALVTITQNLCGLTS